MIMSIAPRRRLNLVDRWLPAPRGRHRGLPISKRLAVMLTGHVAVCVLLSTYATMAAVR